MSSPVGVSGELQRKLAKASRLRPLILPSRLQASLVDSLPQLLCFVAL
jgi:hypothetical protein